MVNPRFVIKAVLSGQRLNINVPLTVAGTVNYIGVEAKCTSEWDDCTVVCYLYQAGTGYTAQLGLIYDAERKLYYFPNAERLTLTAGEWSVWFVGVMTASGQETYKITSETRVFTVYEYPFASSIPSGDITLDEQAIAKATDAQNKANLILDLYNAGKLTGHKGDPGDPAEIGFVQASVDSSTSNPSCVVTVTENPENTYNMQFAFSGIKGAKGDTGATGPKGDTGAQGAPGRDGTDGRDGEDGQTIDDYVLVQAEQPTSETNKMWLKPTASGNPVLIPSAEEFQGVETDVTNLKHAFSVVAGVTQLTDFNANHGYNTTGPTIDINSPASASVIDCTYSACVPGDKFTYIGKGSKSYRAYAFIKSDGTVIQPIAPNHASIQTVVITAPADAAYVVFNMNNSISSPYAVYKGELTEKQNKLTFDSAPTYGSTNPVTSGGVAKDINAVIKNLGVTALEIQENTGYKTNASTVDYQNPTSNTGVDSAYSECAEGDIFVYSGKGSTNYRGWAFLGANNNIISNLPDSAGYYNHILITPPNATHVVFNMVHTVGVNRYPGVYKGMNIGFNPYKGLTYSVMGDSMSAYHSDIPSGNVAYYTTSNASTVGVHSSSEMWYKVMGKILGMTLLVNNSWSGSCVASGVREPTSSNSFLPGSSPDRCGNLGNNPDVILIALGTNDYTYDSSIAQFGSWDGKTPLGTDHTNLTDYDTTTFMTAYATMIARIRKNYPNSIIFCVTPWFTKRYTSGTGVTYLNAITKTYTDYGNAIREVSNFMGCQVIDASNIGFNRINYYPTYAQDNAAKPTHMNATGQLVAGIAVARQLLTLPMLT